MSHVEKPQYTVITADQPIEIRSYAPMIIAEVVIDAGREEAIRAGFRLLADYIFGNNTMKAKIPMTAPVQQQSTHSGWRISFVMPPQYTMQSIPKPSDDHVKLAEIPAQQCVTIQFSGRNSDQNLSQHEKQLMAYIAANHLQTTGTPKYAFYNPPWTLPFMRRNEIMLEIQNISKIGRQHLENT